MLLVVILLAAALVLALALFLRVARNVGPLDLEDYARRNHVSYIPVKRELVEQLQEWSNPVRICLNNHRHDLLVEMGIRQLDADALRIAAAEVQSA